MTRNNTSHGIVDEILPALVDGSLPCAQAYKIAAKLGIEPLKVGLAADDADVRLSRCQLGLFGYGPKAEGKHRIVKPMGEVPAELKAAIEAAIEGQGITCQKAWEIAAKLGIPKMHVSSACETLEVKITICQLGAFPRPKVT